ncbi:ComEA family DNA-binding protein [Microbacterium sp. EYE_5]|uniref:ComEA family DNA-binding protein n=1 Tax=unclassified Microbacterium TaxID=2609290 RepID=UPI002005503A|nr:MULTISPECIES: ComEA family DNA-binding protein [unclassified Microbacterium]MCK6080598.1 ComEA family DNA-binding protein [Microbacterium sp. EYE_382]MCK6085869.1 ComEA family DNA-binding protein [Microbacterium sp. EYE_384]MCK6124633.1 ComEA family DNA-binding protein [Microbacterium sp. EYE_80]MCK6127542.1 ComEA family DNA-binding protein [Microbacterium sp. EYE_79]MCK6141553.1 ComEA family DNA-binding protein [Microbacterium sp. EYE_39]
MGAQTVPGSRRRLGIGAAIVLVVVVAAVTICIGIVRTGAQAAIETVPDAGPRATVEPATVYVHVSGEVRAPGLYRLDHSARVVDAVSAAGGFTDGAAREGVNLARPVTDGEQLVVPAVGDESVEVAEQSPDDGRVNLNTADVAELDTLPRIGPAIAQRILDWRESNGRFTSVDDLMAVPGIGEKMLASLRDLVTV